MLERFGITVCINQEVINLNTSLKVLGGFSTLLFPVLPSYYFSNSTNFPSTFFLLAEFKYAKVLENQAT